MNLLACEHERKVSGVEDDNWDYGCACYESALKAFESLCEDGHSGYSIGNLIRGHSIPWYYILLMSIFLTGVITHIFGIY